MQLVTFYGVTQHCKALTFKSNFPQHKKLSLGNRSHYIVDAYSISNRMKL